MFTISKTWRFSASHQILSLESDHPCRRLHGHNYEITFRFTQDQLNEHGFVRDFNQLNAEIGAWVKEVLDHRHLNDVPGVGTTSSECVAKWGFLTWSCKFPSLVAVRVSEGGTTWAEYEA